MKSEAYKRNVNTRDEFIARILAAAARMKKREYALTRTTRDLTPIGIRTSDRLAGSLVTVSS
jgi:hypothetical protein